MKILVVSGFLGAGKTTFIEKLVKETKKDILILENEYGEVGIDGDLLKKEDINIWEMTEGCICCSMESSFGMTVLTISNTINPEILIIEPTGVGKLSSIMNNISKVQYERIEILEPVTIVDPNCINKYIKEFGEIFVDQILNSNKIIISKTNQFKYDVITEAENKIKELNSNADILKEDYQLFGKIKWDEFLQRPWSRGINKSNGKEEVEIDNIGFSGVCFEDISLFESYMGAIMRGRFGEVIRAKGFLPINNIWSKFDIVNDKYSIEKIESMDSSKIILIGKNLKKNELEVLFSSITDDKLKFNQGNKMTDLFLNIKK